MAEFMEQRALVVNPEGRVSAERLRAATTDLITVRMKIFLPATVANRARRTLRTPPLAADASFSEFVETAIVHELERRGEIDTGVPLPTDFSGEQR